jgi:hypothetical protein
MRNQKSRGVVKLDHSLWHDPENWPHDRPGHVFLARVVDQVGRVMFGDHWNTIEVTNPEPDLPDDGADEAIWDRYDVESDRHDEPCEKAEGAREERRTKIARMIAEQSELNNLKTFFLQQNGRMNRIKSYYWNADDFQGLFRKCKISISGEECWIFVERSSLDLFIRTQPAPCAGQYRRSTLLVISQGHAFRLRKDENYSRTSAQKTQIEAEIKAAWRDSKSLSQNLIDAIVTHRLLFQCMKEAVNPESAGYVGSGARKSTWSRKQESAITSGIVVAQTRIADNPESFRSGEPPCPNSCC